MEIRKSEYSDVNEIMEIIKQAQAYFKSQGINQWQNQYPNEEVIRNDIENGVSYVCTLKGEVAATCVISFEGEKTYDFIEDGAWLTKAEFAVIHRIAVKESLKGHNIASELVKYSIQLCKEKKFGSIRIDTHEQNHSMRAFLKKNHFVYCGVIYLADGARRVAYEKVLAAD